jgi:hypothetical protein
VLPTACLPGFAELSTLTLGTKQDIYFVQLLCSVPKGEKEKKADKKKG